jgi:hypothetical protein
MHTSDGFHDELGLIDMDEMAALVRDDELAVCG